MKNKFRSKIIQFIIEYKFLKIYNLIIKKNILIEFGSSCYKKY